MCSGARGAALQGRGARPRGRAAASCAVAAAARWLGLSARSGRPGLAWTAAFEGRGTVPRPLASWAHLALGGAHYRNLFATNVMRL